MTCEKKSNITKLGDDLLSIFSGGEFKSVKHTHYFPIYEMLFSKFRNKPITFLEIGVLGGGSLLMWRKYFGENARIIGIDLNPKARKWEAHGFEIYIGDQEDPNFWSTITEEIGAVDIVLDDGGHTYAQQIVTTNCILTSIKDGGMLVVEDTHTSYMDGFGPKRYSFINYVKKMIDNLNSRSAEVSGKYKDKSNILSVECFESMVVFKISKVIAQNESRVIINQGVDDGAEDFRDSNSRSISMLRRLGKLIRKTQIKQFAIKPYLRMHHIIMYFKGVKLRKYFKT